MQSHPSLAKQWFASRNLFVKAIAVIGTLTLIPAGFFLGFMVFAVALQLIFGPISPA